MTEPTEGAQAGTTTLDKYKTREGLQRLFTLLVSPHTYTVRSIETLHDRHSYIERQTSLDLASGGVPHFVPVAQPLRGALVDTLKIEPTDSVQDVVLGRIETFAVVQAILTFAAEKAGVPVASPELRPYTLISQLDDNQAFDLFNALRKLRRPGVTVPPELQVPHQLANDATFYKLFRFFRTYQLLLVPCKPATELFKVSYTTHVGHSRYRGRSFAEQARQALGLAPYRLRIEIPLALVSQSYHLRMRSPIQHYARHTELWATYLTITQNPYAAKDWELRKYLPEGPSVKCLYPDQDPDGLTHIYTQNLANATNRPRRFYAKFQLDELPLGQLGGAIVRLSIVLISILLATSMAGGLIGSQSTLLPAILVGLPAILGITSVLNAELGNIFSPIAARIGSVFSSAASIVATFALVSWISSKSACLAAKSCNAAMPPRVHAVFLSVEVSLIVMIVWCACSLIYNIFRYLRRPTGPPIV